MMNNEKIAQLEAEIEQLKIRIIELELLNKWYVEQFRLAQQRLFGASSEKNIPVDQTGLFNEAEAVSDDSETEAEPDQVITYKRKKRAGKREELYEGIPTVQIVHELPEDERVCLKCGKDIRACGHEVLRRELEVIPAQVRAVEHVQTVYACDNCEKNSDSTAMIKSNVPTPVIQGSGIASPSLVSFIICNKYVLALPLYRQEQELLRIGAVISRQTMANWVIYAAEQWLEPIYRLLHEELLKNDVNHADETTVQVIKEDGRKSTQKSYMWHYRTGGCAENAVSLFEYQTTREGKHPIAFLSGFAGYLHVDAYIGYHKLEELDIILVECWAHMRRKFVEALKAVPKKDRAGSSANIGLEYCDRLFELERKYSELELTFEQRFERRNLESKPITEAFFAWAESMIEQTIPKSKLGVAVRYAINQKQWLLNFLLDGRLEPSNNRAENGIRPFAVGRKNWLFSFTPKGAKASAIAYSIVETAQANGLVPFMYLKLLFETLPNIPARRLREFLPWSPLVQEVCKIPPVKK